MAKNRAIILVALLILLSALSLSHAGRKDRKHRKKKTKVANAAGPWCIKAKKAQKTGIVMDCSAMRDGARIASLSVVGVVNECQGLTAHMFVEMTSCLWKEKCTVKKKKDDKYMVKLYEGKPASCVSQSPKYFTVNYECAVPEVTLVDVLKVNPEAVKAEKGILRSHEEYPWLYKRHDDHPDRHVVLRKPHSSSAMDFVYTIRKLQLMYSDSLTAMSSDKTYPVTWNGTKQPPRVISEAENVTFQLNMSRFTTGGEGFIICFQWVDHGTQLTDACDGVLHPGKKDSTWKASCSKGKRTKGGRGKKRKNKKHSKNKKRHSKKGVAGQRRR